MQVNFLLFPELTQLDLTGPFEVLARVPGWQMNLVALSREPVRSDRGLHIVPTVDIEQAPVCDLLVVPGGPGTDQAMLDPRWIHFIAQQAAQASFVLGICTGSLLLGAAGLLKGKRAACHWQARQFLPAFGALPDAARVCRDGRFFTSAGVSSGIDLALQAVAELADEDTARQIQLQIEYAPQPPFAGGTPDSSPPAIVQRCLAATRERAALRAQAVRQAAASLK